MEIRLVANLIIYLIMFRKKSMIDRITVAENFGTIVELLIDRITVAENFGTIVELQFNPLTHFISLRFPRKKVVVQHEKKCANR